MIDIPKDVFDELSEYDFSKDSKVNLPGYNPYLKIDQNQIENAVSLINNAKKPIILAGHGVIISRAQNKLLELAEKAQIPVVTTLLGISAFPAEPISER